MHLYIFYPMVFALCRFSSCCWIYLYWCLLIWRFWSFTLQCSINAMIICPLYSPPLVIPRRITNLVQEAISCHNSKSRFFYNTLQILGGSRIHIYDNGIDAESKSNIEETGLYENTCCWLYAGFEKIELKVSWGLGLTLNFCLNWHNKKIHISSLKPSSY